MTNTILDQDIQVDANAQLVIAKERVKKYIHENSKRFFDSMIRNYNDQMKTFWKNDNGLTPQQVSDALGVRAASLFILGGQLRTFILSINPAVESELENPVNKFTINPDGTVVILDEPYAVEPTT